MSELKWLQIINNLQTLASLYTRGGQTISWGFAKRVQFQKNMGVDYVSMAMYSFGSTFVRMARDASGTRPLRGAADTARPGSPSWG